MTYNEHLIAGVGVAWDCSANEAEKRLAANRKRAAQAYAQPEDVPWTAARCNRLLRTITSRINILKRQFKLVDHGVSGNSRVVTAKRPGQDNVFHSKASTLSALDPEWIPGLEHKSVRAYGRKARRDPAARKKPDTAAKSQSSFATPFVKRLLEPPSADGLVRRSINFDARKYSNSSRQLPVQSSSSNEEAQRNLVRAFGVLLAATKETPEPSRTGSRSLLSVCLRRIPQYIELEVGSSDTDDSDAEDLCSSLYSELESLGTREGGGWIGLRKVVRAHAFRYICNTIEAGLVTEGRISELVSMVERDGTILEAQTLLASWLSLASRVTLVHPAMAKCERSSNYHQASGLYLRMVASMIDSGQMSVLDVVRSGTPILNTLLRVLVRGSEKHAAVDCVRTMVSKASHLGAEGDTTVSRVFRRLAELLTAIAILQNHQTPGSVCHELADVANQLAMNAFLTRESADERSVADVFCSESHPFVMARLTLTMAGQPLLEDFVTPNIGKVLSLATSKAAGDRKFRDELIRFVCSVAAHVSHFTELSHRDSLALVTHGLGSKNDPICSWPDESALQRLNTEISLAFGDQSLATGIPTDVLPDSVSGFTWEEGLCEWVATTPMSSGSESVSADLQLEAGSKDTTDPPVTAQCHLINSETHTPTINRVQKPARDRKNAKQMGMSPDVLAGSPKQSDKCLKDRSVNVAARPRLVSAKDLQKAKVNSCNAVAPGTTLTLQPSKRCKGNPNRSLKRPRSVVQLDGENLFPSRCGPDEEVDELSIASPARKKNRSHGQHGKVSLAGGLGIPSIRVVKFGQRASLPANMLGGDESDDELGL